MNWRRAGRSAAAACLVAVLAGCAAPRPVAVAQAGAIAAQDRWNGRLALQVEDAPSQSFSASFELTGGADAGALILTTPIGSTAAVLQWAPGSATLQQGSKSDAQRFGSLDELAARATGTPIPVAALFEWLEGRPAPVPGWIADLSAQPQGRIVATRQQPLPVATLRVVFER